MSRGRVAKEVEHESPIPPPRALNVSSLRSGGEEWLIFSFPLPQPEWPEALTPAERAVATLLLEGASNADIARHRRTSERTVTNQVASIFRKAGVSTRLELAACIFGAHAHASTAR